MKHMKKLVSLMLAAVMVLAMTVTVSAAEPGAEGGSGPAEITVTNATKDAIYTLYKVFDATVNDENPDDVRIAYTWPEGKTWTDNEFFAKDAKGNISALPDAFKEGSTEQLSEGAIGWIEANGTKVTEATATEQTLVFKGLEYGYYYVSSNVKETGGVITVTSTTPKASVIDKNQKPSWPDEGKTIIGEDGTPMLPDADGKIISDGAFGDEVKFQISVKATNYLDDKKIIEYTINDTIDPGLDYNKDSLVVTVGDKTLDAAAGEYTVEWDAATDHAFKLTIPWVDNADDKNLLYDANSLITVTYTTTINKDAEIAGDGSDGNKNKAKFEYITEDGEPHEDEREEETITYTYALGIQKTDEKGNPLAGATFGIKNPDGTDLWAVPVEGQPGVYEHAKDENVPGAVKEFVTGTEGAAKGQIIIKGVREGVYEITELKAPDGYNMLTDPKTVEAQRTGATSYKKTYTVYYDKDGNIVKEEEAESSQTYEFPFNVSEITIVNHSGTQLPSTGGIGTTLFYIIGGVLALGALVLLVTRKRMSRE